MNCQWPNLKQGAVCVRPGCGTTLRRDYDQPPNCQCRGQQLAGDWIESRLKAVGITQEWYKAAKAELGLPPDCHCPQRIAKLNEWTRKAIDWWKGKLDGI
jgi:hypothetical protein